MKLRTMQYFAGLIGIVLILVNFFGGDAIFGQVGIALVLVFFVLLGLEKWNNR